MAGAAGGNGRVAVCGSWDVDGAIWRKIQKYVIMGEQIEQIGNGGTYVYNSRLGKPFQRI